MIRLSLPLAIFAWAFQAATEVRADDDCEPMYRYRFRLPQAMDTFDTRIMSAWSGGGGPIWQFGDDYLPPFRQRQYGSGDRKTIYGSRAYGSGYPYGVADTSNVRGRPFPYGSWPLYWSGGYMGGDEYAGDAIEAQRPGGSLVVVAVSTTDTEKWNVTTEETYWMVGDRDSTLSIMASMVDWCHATPRWPVLFDPSTTTSTDAAPALAPQNILQYYRASSFALAHPGYNNSFAILSSSTTPNTELTHDQSTPLNDTQIYSPFLRCINETIADALPILDKPFPKPLPNGILAAILCSIFLGPCVLGAGFACLWTCIKSARVSRAAKRNRVVQRETVKADYEAYP